ncbi:MAG TPA: GNAT family N-acetyltransferase [Rhodocyclaceae bacterium]|jgi:uncharacterized protein|nr:GNAT family N-acetyltransferase [Rhodocyclaceae bacterium]HRQ47858.1 GNAT family N-acetyltransferase [Rhodocyclaceae bacterium]
MESPFQLRLIERLSDIDPHAWNAIAGPQVCVSHALLTTLEDTGCVGGQSGWHPCHVGLWRDDSLVAALPLYEKHHSYGEYVFDWAWADAYARSGLAYYPKLLSAIPFTPIPGMRLLGTDDDARRALIAIAAELAQASEISSLHILFPTDIEAQWMREAGFLIRQGVQFHWLNRGYGDFDAFLTSLNHDKRKKIRQERRRATAHGLTLRWLDGHQATAADWSYFYGCYANTYALHRSTPYLTPDFFTALARRAPESVRLLIARRGAERVASAFFLCDGKALYGRYWGASEHLPFVHFELCYYQAIEYCIDHGLQRFEGGAQGEHKLARGLEPTVTRSAHWIRDPRFRDAVDRHLARESAGMDFYLDELSERSPFRRTHTPLP